MTVVLRAHLCELNLPDRKNQAQFYKWHSSNTRLKRQASNQGSSALQRPNPDTCAMPRVPVPLACSCPTLKTLAAQSYAKAQDKTQGNKDSSSVNKASDTGGACAVAVTKSLRAQIEPA